MSTVGASATELRVLHHAHSKGMEAASNAGIHASTGEFVVIHDDDDSWHPDFLRETVDYLDYNVAIPPLASAKTVTLFGYVKNKIHKFALAKNLVKLSASGQPLFSQLSSPAMRDPALACVAFVVANDAAAHNRLLVLRAVGDAFPVRLHVMDRVRGEGDGKVFGLSSFDPLHRTIHGPGMGRLARLRPVRSLHARIVSEFRRVRPSLIALNAICLLWTT
jgi:glycosyltransferase involved in cell wall biosynthesis